MCVVNLFQGFLGVLGSLGRSGSGIGLIDEMGSDSWFSQMNSDTGTE